MLLILKVLLPFTFINIDILNISAIKTLLVFKEIQSTRLRFKVFLCLDCQRKLSSPKDAEIIG